MFSSESLVDDDYWLINWLYKLYALLKEEFVKRNVLCFNLRVSSELCDEKIKNK
jgi:hypothetical protein